MENWGLITYRETALLLPPAGASMRAQRSVASTIAHEMSHLVRARSLCYLSLTAS
jgi:puromycin-sensitive aminopeptidase